MERVLEALKSLKIDVDGLPKFSERKGGLEEQLAEVRQKLIKGKSLAANYKQRGPAEVRAERRFPAGILTRFSCPCRPCSFRPP